MIVITGSVLTNAANHARIEKLCIEHSRRSRGEAGCLSHNVHADCEQPERLVFVERWTSAGAVQDHFKLRESREFVKEITELSTQNPTIEIYRAESVPAAALG